MAAGTSGRAQQIPEMPPPARAAVSLLEVRINGWRPGLVARFVEQDGRLRLPAQQFDGLGFRPDQGLVTEIDGEPWVWLDRVAGLSWTIDRRSQTIDFTVPPRLLKTTELRVAPGVPRIAARADWGALLAWDAFGQWSPRDRDPLFSRSFSADLDARIFSPRFTLVSRGVVLGGADRAARLLRLESYADFDDPEHSRQLRIGDSFTRSSVWVRTLRFAGVQWGSDFTLRPDLVTMPVPILDQEVSVPSTVDLFVNGVQRYSDAVTPGPVRLTDLPVVTGANTIRTVVTDRSGRRTELVLPFYASTALLAKGMTDFSLAAGFPRQEYGVASNEYGRAFASAVASRGITDRLTLHGYAAGSRGYWGAAAGATADVGGYALLDGALMSSRAGGDTGWSFYLAASRTTPRFNLSASYARAFSYTDLAAWFGYVRFIEAARVSGGVNFGAGGQFNLIYSRQRNWGQSLTNIVSGTYGIDVGPRRRIRVSGSAYADAGIGSWGAVLSLAVPLGRDVQAYARQAWRDGRPTGQLQVQGTGFDSRLDWQVDASTGQDQGRALDAYASWDGAKADGFARATHLSGSTGFQAEIAQSLVWMGSDLFLTGRIDDAFTVVDTNGIPDVRVALENRPVGRTGRSGRLLVTDLQSYLPNAISVDATDLPIDAAIADSALLVAPRGGAGLVTRFAAIRARSAIVVLERADGTPPPAGASVRLTGTSFAAPMGYDGEIYVRGLARGANRLEVEWRDGRCAATFPGDFAEGTLPRLGPFRCEP